MDVAAGRVPARAMGLTYASIDPGAHALRASIETAAETAPRGPLDVAVKVEGIEAGDTAYVTIAAVDQGILNLTAFTPPDPSAYYFGQQKLGVGIRDIYGRLIDPLNGVQGEVRSGGDAGAQARLQAPPPTEELVAYFTGPVMVGVDGYARANFTLPSFNGTVKIMAVAWSKRVLAKPMPMFWCAIRLLLPPACRDLWPPAMKAGCCWRSFTPRGPRVGWGSMLLAMG